MKFHIKVYDNFHYADESAAYIDGEYATYKEALMKAQSIVAEFLQHNWKSGISPSALLELFHIFGEDPVIIPEPDNKNLFSARGYAREIAPIICKKMEDSHS